MFFYPQPPLPLSKCILGIFNFVHLNADMAAKKIPTTAVIAPAVIVPAALTTDQPSTSSSVESEETGIKSCILILYISTCLQIYNIHIIIFVWSFKNIIHENYKK